jgi:TldD protein
MSEDVLDFIISLATKLGAQYCDVRIIKNRFRVIRSNNANIDVYEETNDGIGIRVLTNGSWGFSGSSSVERELCKDLVEKAIKMARTTSMYNRKSIKLIDVKSVDGKYVNEFKKNPLTAEETNVIDLLNTTTKTLKEQSDKITSASASFKAFVEERYVATSEGSKIYQKLTGCGAIVQGKAMENGLVVSRSYPQTLDFNVATKGYEWIEETDLVSKAAETGKELLKLLSAPSCPYGFTNLILADDLLALQIHETIGHPTELDRVLDTEWDFAGSSFLTPDKLGTLRFGSESVNVVADPTISGGPGTYKYDDEAVEGKTVYLIKNGMFVGYQSSREMAAKLNLEESSGGMRAMDGMHPPLIRMNNINLLPGDWTREEIISDTREGILMTGPIMEIFDQRRRTFIFGAEIGWRIKKGDLVEVIRNPVYCGKTLSFWQGCDAIAKDGWTHYSSGCGKGRPHQRVRVGHYCSMARFVNVQVGAPV